MPKRDRKHMTLGQRAFRYGDAHAKDTHGEGVAAEQGFIAGWHARGRADRVTKAERKLLDVVRRYCLGKIGFLELVEARANLERAKGRK